jgi:hypothetical protein
VGDYFEKLAEKGKELLINIKRELPELKKLYEKHSDHWNYEDIVYRFYHQSFKVYAVQGQTQQIVKKLESLAPEGVKFNSFFKEILKSGAPDKKFSSDHNEKWLEHTRPMIEAFMHARFFLEMAIKYGEELEEAPTALPSGWAALLYFYNLR